MSTKDTGGPAFPWIECIRNEAFPSQPIPKGVPGMTLRDYFAAKAMQGMIERPGSIDVHADAAWSYQMADAMLKARQA